MDRQIEYYLNLKYKIEIERIPSIEGGGYAASIPQLGKYAFRGDGSTADEALQSLEIIKEDLFKKYLSKNIPIPNPEIEDEQLFSGRFVLRLPVELHRYLSYEAKSNQSTLNQYCLYLLTRKSYLSSIQDEIQNIRKTFQDVFSQICDIRYQIEHQDREIKKPRTYLIKGDYAKSA